MYENLENILDAYYITEAPEFVHQYQRDDVLAYPIDPDGPVVRAKLLSGTIPAGAHFDTQSGRITIDTDDYNDLVPDTSFPLVIETKNAAGGVTTHRIDLFFKSDQPATMFIEPARHIGTYNDDDILVEIEDPNGSIISATFSPEISGTIFALELKNGDLVGRLRVDLAGSNELKSGSTVFTIETTDVDYGTTQLSGILTINPDHVPDFEPRIVNEDVLVEGINIATLKDDVDGGLQDTSSYPYFLDMSDNPLDLYATLGITVAADGAIPNGFSFNIVSTADLALFQSKLKGGSALFSYSSAERLYRYNFQIVTLDGQNYEATQTATFSIIEDVDASWNQPFQPKHVLAYSEGDLLIKFGDPNSATFNALTEIPGTPSLSDLGMELSLDQGGIIVKQGAIATFQSAVDTYYADYSDASQNIVGQIVHVTTEDATGGISTLQPEFRIIKNQPTAADMEPLVARYMVGPGTLLGTIYDDNLGINHFTPTQPSLITDLGLTFNVGLGSTVQVLVDQADLFMDNVQEPLFTYNPTNGVFSVPIGFQIGDNQGGLEPFTFNLDVKENETNYWLIINANPGILMSQQRGAGNLDIYVELNVSVTDGDVLRVSTSPSTVTGSTATFSVSGDYIATAYYDSNADDLNLI